MKLSLILGRWSTGLHGQLDVNDLYVRRALTGSESSFFNIGRALAERGHQVDIFCDCPAEGRSVATLGSLNVLNIDREIGADYDAYVSLNEPNQLKRAPKGKLRICWQQLGDFPGNQEPDYDHYVDRYVALSPRHMEYIIGSSAEGPLRSTASKWCWAPNSINVDMVEGPPPVRRPGSMVWCSSPDRGLHRLLEIFPSIKEEVPEATLDIFYRFDPWYDRAKELQGPTGDRARYIGECLSRLGRDGENGVKVWGPVSNVEMATRLRETVLLPYTCDVLCFTETFSVSIMDACLAGCVPLISDEDAIGEVFKDAAVIIPGKPGRKQDEWRVNCCLALTNDEWARKVGAKATAFAANFHRGRVVQLWERILMGSPFSMPKTISEYVEKWGVGTGITKVKDKCVGCEKNEADPSDGRFCLTCIARKRDRVPLPPIDVVVSGDAKVEPMKVPATVAQTFSVELVDRPLRIAVMLGKTGSSVHGILDVARVFEDDGAFATGTVTGFFNIAWGLAERGHTVDAFCECKENVVGSKLGGAHFYNMDKEQVSDGYDAFISVNEPDMLKGKPADKLKIVALWLNDFSVAGPGWDNHVDVYACPSETHKIYVRGRGEVPVEKLDMVPLCVNPELHDEALPRRLGSIAYCSSPDRGLHHLLSMFPEIKARVPHANLRVYYRVKPWYETIVSMKPLDGTHMRWRADQIKTSFDDLGEDGSRGVTLVGPVSPRRMARELRQTMVLAYPCDVVRFTEGFGAAVLDACAAGCVPIVAGVDALTEVYWGGAHLISGNPGERKKAWIDAICLALTDEGFATEVRQSARARAREFTRQKVAARWEALIKGHMTRRGQR